MVPRWVLRIVKGLHWAMVIAVCGPALIFIGQWWAPSQRMVAYAPHPEPVASLADLAEDWSFIEFIWHGPPTLWDGDGWTVPGFLINVPTNSGRSDSDWLSGIRGYSRISTASGRIVEVYPEPQSSIASSVVPMGWLPNRPVAFDPFCYSTYDIGPGARVIFGPAPEPLWQFSHEIRDGQIVITGIHRANEPGPHIRGY